MSLLKNKFIWIGGSVLLLTGSIVVAVNANKAKTEQTDTGVSDSGTGSGSKVRIAEGVEVTLDSDMQKEQNKLESKYGKAPEGLFWGDEGELIPYGNPNLMPEEVASNYLKALSILNIGEAQKYAYRTATLKAYDKLNSRDTDFSYANTFKKEMYKTVLLSVQPLQVQDTSNFANGKVVLTMQVEVLDLSDKDFWKKNSETIFTNIYIARKGENDTTKAKRYTYDLILDYYKADKVKTRVVNVSMTLEKAYSGGYVVTKDDELDAVAQYLDGETVASNMLDLYERWVNSQDEAKLKALVEKVQKEGLGN